MLYGFFAYVYMDCDIHLLQKIIELSLLWGAQQWILQHEDIFIHFIIFKSPQKYDLIIVRKPVEKLGKFLAE